MEDGGNILKLGDDLKAEIGKIQQDMPVGLEIHQVSDQPSVVAESIHDFVKTLVEAIVIVLAVSFLSLGFRTGLVVAAASRSCSAVPSSSCTLWASTCTKSRSAR